MTPGQAALAEAARIETARIYGRTVPEHRNNDDARPGPAADLDAARVRATHRLKAVAS